jgi:hypothetical protein
VVHGKTCQACGGDGWIDDDEKLRRQSMEGGGGFGKDSLQGSRDSFGLKPRKHHPGEAGEEETAPRLHGSKKPSRRSRISGGHSDDSRVQIIGRRVEIVG